MQFDISHDGRTTLATNHEKAKALGYPEAVIGAAMKGAAKAQIAAFADGYRAKLASASAGKLASYRIKEEIARDPSSASEAELALLDREAAARGVNRDALLADIGAKATAYRQVALLIEALEAEANAAIAAVQDDDADIEAQILTALAAAKAQADLAFTEAAQLINGG